ncbi:MAG: molybdate ABC transporter substrate-binding protein, partial [Pseudomonadota bacterium]
EDVFLIAGNQLDIAVAKSEVPVSDAKILLDKGRFAMADPDTVPAGRYAKAALESLGIWEEIRQNAVFTENVRVALRMAARGDVQAAIVYGSDIPIEPALHAGYEFAAKTHPPIVYPAGEIKNGSADATKFLEFLRSETVQKLLRQSGFSNLVPAEN